MEFWLYYKNHQELKMMIYINLLQIIKSLLMKQDKIKI